MYFAFESSIMDNEPDTFVRTNLPTIDDYFKTTTPVDTTTAKKELLELLFTPGVVQAVKSINGTKALKEQRIKQPQSSKAMDFIHAWRKYNKDDDLDVEIDPKYTTLAALVRGLAEFKFVPIRLIRLSIIISDAMIAKMSETNGFAKCFRRTTINVPTGRHVGDENITLPPKDDSHHFEIDELWREIVFSDLGVLYCRYTGRKVSSEPPHTDSVLEHLTPDERLLFATDSLFRAQPSTYTKLVTPEAVAKIPGVTPDDLSNTGELKFRTNLNLEDAVTALDLDSFVHYWSLGYFTLIKSPSKLIAESLAADSDDDDDVTLGKLREKREKNRRTKKERADSERGRGKMIVISDNEEEEEDDEGNDTDNSEDEEEDNSDTEGEDVENSSDDDDNDDEDENGYDSLDDFIVEEDEEVVIFPPPAKKKQRSRKIFLHEDEEEDWLLSSNIDKKKEKGKEKDKEKDKEKKKKTSKPSESTSSKQKKTDAATKKKAYSEMSDKQFTQLEREDSIVMKKKLEKTQFERYIVNTIQVMESVGNIIEYNGVTPTFMVHNFSKPIQELTTSRFFSDLKKNEDTREVYEDLKSLKRVIDLEVEQNQKWSKFCCSMKRKAREAESDEETDMLIQRFSGSSKKRKINGRCP